MVTNHAVSRYSERVNPAATVKDAVIKIIRMIYDSSKLVSKDKRGSLYRNNELAIDMVVKHGKVITLFNLKREIPARHRR